MKREDLFAHLEMILLEMIFQGDRTFRSLENASNLAETKGNRGKSTVILNYSENHAKKIIHEDMSL